ncbi:carboxypeptidase regulatory-like domain-containing protein, partial [Pyxidicoccus sp. 3LG]
LPGPSKPTPPPRGHLSVRGRVLDEEHNPVAGVAVSATRAMPGESLSQLPCDAKSPDISLTSAECETGEAADVLTELVLEGRGAVPVLAQVTTAEDGTFTLDSLPEGTVALWAFSEDSSVMNPEVATGSEGVELVLEWGLRVEGRVVDEAGGPLPGARVQVFHTTHSRFFDASTDADGRFSIGPLPSGDYNLVASRPGLLPTLVTDVAYSDLDAIVLYSPRRITGQVLSGGTPAPGAEVRLSYSTQVAVADGEGRFVLESIGPGDYEVIAERDGLYGFVPVSIEEEVQEVRVTVHLGTLLYVEGVVQDEAGRPIAGAEVVAYPDVNAPGVDDAISGPDGRFRLGPLVPGKHSFSVDADGYLELSPEDLEVSASSPPPVFTLVRAFVLSGIVTDTEGNPLSGQDLEASKMGTPTRRRGSRRVRLPSHHAPLIVHRGRSYEDEELERVEPDEDSSLPDPETATSDEEGRFSFELPEEGRYAVVSTGGQYLFTRVEADAPSSDVRVVLRTGAVLNGSVVDARGEPLFQVRMSLKYRAIGEEQELERMSDEQGKFTLEGLPPGSHTLQGTLDRGGVRHQVSQTVSVQGAEPVEVKVRLDTGLQVSGVVVDTQGRPVEDAEVWGYTLQPQPEGREGARPSTATTGPDGRFTLEHLVEGPCVLSVVKEGYAFDVPEPVQGQRRQGTASRAGARDARLVLRYEGYLRGRVVQEDGTPVPRFTINHAPFRAEDGTFELPMGSEPTLELRIDAPGLTRAVLEMKVKPGQDMDVGEVRLSRGRQVKGRVVDGETSLPVSGAMVWVSLPGEEEWRAEHSPLAKEHTDVDGAFTLPPLQARTLKLRVRHPGYPMLRQLLGAGDETLELRLYSGARVEGTVTDREGRPVDTTVALEPLDFSGRTADITTAGGAFALQGLEAGNYAVHADGVTAADGREVRFLPQRVHLPPTGRVVLALTEQAGGATVRLSVRRDLPANRVPGMVITLVQGEVSPDASHEELMTLTRRQALSTAPERAGHSELVYERLPGGRYTLLCLVRLDFERYEAHLQTLDVPEGGTVEHELQPVWRPVPATR